MSYYKYAQRQVDSQINWAEIGKTMSETLKDEAAGRERLKGEIDEASRQYGETLSDAPTGDYDAGNTFALDYASNAQEYRLMQDRLLRSGQLNLRDYNIGRQNVMDGTANLFDLAKEYQEEYKTKMDRWDGDKSSFREVWEMEQAEGLGNLRASRGYINPTNGAVSVGKMVKDTETGIMKLSQDPNDFATVNDLRQRLKQQYNRFDVATTTGAAVDQLGVIESEVFNRASRGRVNTIITTVDAKQGDYTLEDEEFVATYKEWEDVQVSSMMVNPNDVASVLTDYKLTAPNGERYTFTKDKDEFDAQGEDGNLIFLDQSENASGVPLFNEKQEQTVEETLKISIRAQIDEKAKVRQAGVDQFKPQTVIDSENREDQQTTVINDFAKLFYGNAQEKQEAAQSISSVNEKIVSIEAPAGGTGVTITYDDNTTRFMPYGTSEEAFVTSNVNFAYRGMGNDAKIMDIDERVSRTRLSGATEPNTESFSIERGQAFDANKVMKDELVARALTLNNNPKLFGDDPTSDQEKELAKIKAFSTEGDIAAYYQKVTGKPVPTKPEDSGIDYGGL